MAIKITKVKLETIGDFYYRIEDTKDIGNKSWALYEYELKSLHTKIGKILNIPDFKKAMGKDKGKFIGRKTCTK